MGFNTIHVVSGDYVEGYDLTKKKHFKFQVLDKEDISKLQLVQGLDLEQSQLSIVITSHYDVSINDKVEVMGKQYIVTGVSNIISNPLQCRYRRDFNDMTGSSVMTLA